MTSCSSSSDEEIYNQQQNGSGQNSVTTKSLDQLSTEEALRYLSNKYSNRFSSEDALFQAALDRETIPPPIVLNYNGKQQLNARRSGSSSSIPNQFNNRRYDNNERRYDHHQGGGSSSRRYNESRGRGGGGGGGGDYGRRYDRNERR